MIIHFISIIFKYLTILKWQSEPQKSIMSPEINGWQVDLEYLSLSFLIIVVFGQIYGMRFKYEKLFVKLVRKLTLEYFEFRHYWDCNLQKCLPELINHFLLKL